MGIPWYLATTRMKNILRDYGLEDQNISMYIRVSAPSTFLRPSFVCHQINIAWGRQHSGCFAARSAADWESGCRLMECEASQATPRNHNVTIAFNFIIHLLTSYILLITNPIVVESRAPELDL